jgi:hypothetical protein
MFRRLPALAVMAALMLLGSSATSANAEEKPRPNFSMSGQPTTAAVDAYWFCHGHANTPHSISYPDTGIGYDGYSDCEGAYTWNQMCVKLQELDYYKQWYDRTSYSCVGGTQGHVYAGAYVPCSGAHAGTFRTYGRNGAWPNGTPIYSYGASYSISKCAGY